MRFRLKEIRQKAGMTQEKLAEVSGVSRPTIWQIENRFDYDTSIGTLERLAEALGVKVSDIFPEDA